MVKSSIWIWKLYNAHTAPFVVVNDGPQAKNFGAFFPPPEVFCCQYRLHFKKKTTISRPKRVTRGYCQRKNNHVIIDAFSHFIVTTDFCMNDENVRIFSKNCKEAKKMREIAEH